MAKPEARPNSPKRIRGGNPTRPEVVARVTHRMELFMDGTLTVEDLDDEELIRGQLRDKNGNFTGRPPNVIPRSFHSAVVRELVHRGEGRLKEHLDTAIDTMVEIAKNPRANPQARIQAAAYLWERLAGKIPEKAYVEATIRPYETVVRDVLVDLGDG